MSNLDRTIIEQLNSLKQRVADLTAQESIKVGSSGLPYFPALTAGSVLFAGTGGILAQDNANLFWDDTNNYLGIGVAPSVSLDVARGTGAGGTAQLRGTTNVSHFNYSTTEDTYIRGGKSTSNVIIADAGANVGIGTASPTTAQKLTIDGGQRNRNAAATRYRSDWAINSGGSSMNVYDDTGSVYLPWAIDCTTMQIRNPQGFFFLDISAGGAGQTTYMRLGHGTTGNRYSHIDLRGDDYNGYRISDTPSGR